MGVSLLFCFSPGAGSAIRDLRDKLPAMTGAIIGFPAREGFSTPAVFSNPLRTFSAHSLEEVLPLLQAIDEEAKAGFWVVTMLSYESAPAFDSALRTHPPRAFPLAWAGVFRTSSPETESSREERYSFGPLNPAVTRSEFDGAVLRIRELIAQGDTYQVNYTFPLTTRFKGDPESWYHKLCEAQEAQYSAYLDLGDYKVLSLSPELFFERNGAEIRTRPMKGTIRRGRWSAEDEQMAQTLLASAKDRAENVMIVDLLRNDLGKVSQAGSVNVARLFELERYPTLWQLTSTVEATLKDGVGLSEIMVALFPCGSITGAPKIRTMEIIRDLEPFPRNLYTGTIGLIHPGGDCTFNVAIRTLIIEESTGKATLGVGGGITYDSDAASEYAECLLKSSFIHRRTPEFHLLESMLLEDGEWFLFERHIARIRASAKYFGFRLDERQMVDELTSLTRLHPKGCWKVRLLLAKSGEMISEAIELDELRSPLRICLAAKPVDETDPFLFHKTTNRALYLTRMVERGDCEDQVFWNSAGKVTESSVANVVVSIDDCLWTPSQESGLLSGTFREELLARGEIKEREIAIEELQAAREIFLINSVRRWMPAVMVD